MKRKAFHQNDIDGLCGMMSVINSAKYLYSDVFDHTGDTNPLSDSLSEHVVKGISATKFRNIWLNGCELPEVKLFCDRVSEFGLRLTRKHLSYLGDDVSRVLDEIREALEEPDTCVIIGFEGPWAHWSVITEVTDDSVVFFDSSYLTTLKKSDIITGKTSVDGKHCFCSNNVLIIRKPK